MRFVRELRGRGDSGLAREYLEKLAQTAPPELKKELPLEFALTNMEAAALEPDSGKRMALYAQARADFRKFLQDNPKHPREAEARLDIARATTLEGKTQLSRALLEEDLPARIAEGLKARGTLTEAFNQLKQLPANPQTELAMGLNVFDQAETYLNTGSDKELLERGKRVEEARKILEKLAQGDPNDRITWQARAWVGRCVHELGEPKKARDLYTDITSATGPA
jgi:tetratricopeptide (TPR) repeat protein